MVDNEGMRYSHPNVNMIGQKFVGGDESRVVKDGDVYISEAIGTLGRSLRAFVPIYNIEKNKEIGFVCVGMLTKSIEQSEHMAILYIILISIGSLAVGIVGAFILSNNIKNTLLGLEPEEITNLYNEKIGILDAIYEGLIAIDNNGNITLVNDSALNILHYENQIDKKSIIGKSIDEIFPTTNLVKVLEEGKCKFEEEQKINNTVIMTNKIPIKDREKVIGAIATFRDKTEVTRLAEELTGVKKMAWSLRLKS
ncbi:PAS domain-containing protein [Paraclostridium bifermentans]|uniref:PAS domain-containing protein n=1 Tax=Paraclostridium bifermentans TaxID=1490 RepID=A0ABY8R3T4_PARBF|nr:PAS domain-containing protein [Paraclostridium bifermentans]